MNFENDPELLAFFSKTKGELKSNYDVYLEKHPEVNQLLNDFVSSLLLKKPENIFDFAKDYFSFYNSAKDGSSYPVILLVSPPHMKIVRPPIYSQINAFKFQLKTETNCRRHLQKTPSDF